MGARATLGLLAALTLSALTLSALTLAACAAPQPKAALNPLFSAAPGEAGELVGKPPEPERPSEPLAPERCKHVYEPHSTHLAVDRLTGLPTLCAVTICRKCGELRHECSPPPRR